MQRLNLLHCQIVIAAHNNLRAQFAQVLDKVVGKRIVVVEDEDHGEFQCSARRDGQGVCLPVALRRRICKTHL